MCCSRNYLHPSHREFCFGLHPPSHNTPEIQVLVHSYFALKLFEPPSPPWPVEALNLTVESKSLPAEEKDENIELHLLVEVKEQLAIILFCGF